MIKELTFTKKVGITDSDLFEWIEDFFSKRRVKANDEILISHDLVENLADHLFTEITKKINN
jgi:hypothetical protein